MIKRLMKHTANFAVCERDIRSFYISAVGVRADGAIVHARNGENLYPDVQAHAEARLCKKLGKGATVVFVARYRYATSGLAMAKPCSRCEAILKNHNVKTVYYSTDDGDFVKMEL